MEKPAKSRIERAITEMLQAYPQSYSLLRGEKRNEAIQDWCAHFGVSKLKKDFTRTLLTAARHHNLAEGKHARELFLVHPISAFYLWLDGLLVRIVPNSFSNNSRLMEVLENEGPDVLVWDNEHDWCFATDHDGDTLFLYR